MNEFKEFLQKKGIKKSKIWEVLDITSRPWSNREENPKMLTIGELEKLSKELNVAPSYLLRIILNDPNA